MPQMLPVGTKVVYSNVSMLSSDVPPKSALRRCAQSRPSDPTLNRALFWLGGGLTGLVTKANVAPPAVIGRASAGFTQIAKPALHVPLTQSPASAPVQSALLVHCVPTQ